MSEQPELPTQPQTVDASPEETQAAAQKLATQVLAQPKPPIMASGNIAAIVPANLEEAWRLSDAFVKADMVPSSYIVKRDSSGKEVKNWESGTVDEKATTARVMIGIMHGMAVGFAPTIALANIMIINNKASIYGDGASALVNASGKAEYIKTEITGTWAGEDYKVTVRAKRRDQDAEIVREFSFQDAKRAGLYQKKSSPWLTYPERQCYWRAWSWACRDAFSDALCGLAIAEEVNDYQLLHERERADKPVDTSNLVDRFTQAQDTPLLTQTGASAGDKSTPGDQQQ